MRDVDLVLCVCRAQVHGASPCFDECSGCGFGLCWRCRADPTAHACAVQGPSDIDILESDDMDDEDCGSASDLDNAVQDGIGELTPVQRGLTVLAPPTV